MFAKSPKTETCKPRSEAQACKLWSFADHIAVMGAAFLVVASIAGCGGSASRQVAARVDDVPIGKAAVDHWEHVIALGGPIDGSLGSSHNTPRREALDFLISAHWIIGEAAERGLMVSARAVERGVKQRMESSPNGDAGFQRELSLTGETISDVRLETRAALASAMLRKTMLRRVPVVTQSEAAGFYGHHRRLFRQDRRIVDLIEGIESPAAAITLGRHLGAGSRFAQRAIRETVARPSLLEAEYSENRELVHAIFATSPGKIGGPVGYNDRWVLLVVRAIFPGATKPFRTVDAELTRHLSKERQRLVLARFLKTYRDRWTARTSCRAGFVIQKCLQYRGITEPETNPLDTPQ